MNKKEEIIPIPNLRSDSLFVSETQLFHHKHMTNSGNNLKLIYEYLYFIDVSDLRSIKKIIHF